MSTKKRLINGHAVDVCLKQHIIPKSILKSFSLYSIYKPRHRYHRYMYALHDSGEVSKISLNSLLVSRNSEYSLTLDDTWMKYEDDVGKFIHRFQSEDGEKSVSYDDYVKYLKPLMAGTVARSDTLMKSLLNTVIHESVYWTGIDVLRTITMETVMSALSYAKISMTTPDGGEFVMPDEAYVFNEKKRIMLVPLAPDLAISAEWDEDPLSTTRIIPDVWKMGYSTFPAIEEQDLAAMTSSKAVLSDSKDVLDGMMIMGYTPNCRKKYKNFLMRWIYSWLPVLGLRTWVDFVLMTDDGLCRQLIDYDRNDPIESRMVFKELASITDWVPPVTVMPNKDMVRVSAYDDVEQRKTGDWSYENDLNGLEWNVMPSND